MLTQESGKGKKQETIQIEKSLCDLQDSCGTAAPAVFRRLAILRASAVKPGFLIRVHQRLRGKFLPFPISVISVYQW
jgi:hypothetical protein